MNVLLGVERALLADVAKVYNELKTIDDKTMTGLAFFYGYDILLNAIDLLKHTKRLVLYHTNDHISRRRLYQFYANKNQVSIYTISSGNFCTCTFYKEEILLKQVYFACPHNLAIKLYEQIFQSIDDVDIETFDVSDEYFIEKMTKLIEQSTEMA